MNNWLDEIIDGFMAIAAATLVASFLWACYQTFGFNPLAAFGLEGAAEMIEGNQRGEGQ